MKTKQFFLILAAITFAGSALANGSTPKTVVAVAPIIAPTSDFTSHYNYDPAVSGIVLGVEAGIDTLATPRSQMFDPQAISGSQRNRAHDFAWGVNLGYKWAVERNALVGVELGYKDFGQSEYKATVNSSSAGIPTGDWKREIRERALDALVTGTYILPYNFNLFGKMGVAAVRSETMQDSPGGVADTNRHNRVYGLRPEVELGFGYVFKEFNI
ncbi:MAG: hypothetical protein KAT71_07305 [Gammaproteobacteria bacterium]|nr:hypothetical protein [Gammaproteobacteria bacterium]